MYNKLKYKLYNTLNYIICVRFPQLPFHKVSKTLSPSAQIHFKRYHSFFDKHYPIVSSLAFNHPHQSPQSWLPSVSPEHATVLPELSSSVTWQLSVVLSGAPELSFISPLTRAFESLSSQILYPPFSHLLGSDKMRYKFKYLVWCDFSLRIIIFLLPVVST